MANDRMNFYYDPARQGYDTTLLKTIEGTPEINGGNIELNEAKFIGYADIFKGELHFDIVVPTVPTTGDYRQFGFEQLNEGASAVFVFDGEDFYVATSFQGEVTMIPVEWNPAWTNTATRFTVKWTGFSAEFLINGVQQFNASTVPSAVEAMPMTFINDVTVPKIPMSVSVSNETADNLLVISYQTMNVQGYI